MKTTDGLKDALQIAYLAEGTMHTEELSKQYLDTIKRTLKLMASTTSPNGTRVRVLAMVNDIAQAVVSENTKGTVAIVGLNTHPRDAQHGRRNVISVRKKGTFQNVAAPGLTRSHNIDQGRTCM